MRSTSLLVKTTKFYESVRIVELIQLCTKIITTEINLNEMTTNIRVNVNLYESNTTFTTQKNGQWSTLYDGIDSYKSCREEEENV